MRVEKAPGHAGQRLVNGVRHAMRAKPEIARPHRGNPRQQLLLRVDVEQLVNQFVALAAGRLANLADDDVVHLQQAPGTEADRFLVHRPLRHVGDVHRIEHAGAVQIAGDDFVDAGNRRRRWIAPLERHDGDRQRTRVAADDLDFQLRLGRWRGQHGQDHEVGQADQFFHVVSHRRR